MRSDDPSRRIVLSWEGDDEELKRSVLVDKATGTRIPATERSYAFQLTGESRTFRWKYKKLKNKNKDDD